MDTWRLSLAVCAALAFAGAPAAGAGAAGDLVAHYTFDDGRGNVLKDRSGRGNDGKVLGGPEWVKLPKGAALKFDGKDDSVEVPWSPSLNLFRRGTALVWIKPAALRGGVLCWHLGSGWQDERFVVVWFRGDGPALYLSDGNYVTGASWPPVKPNRWICLTVTWDGQTVRQYRDGLFLREFEVQGPLNLGGAPLRLGRSRGLGHPCYRGLMGEVRIHNRALSAAEVFDAYARSAPAYGKPVPSGSKRLKLSSHVLLEEGPQVVVSAGVGEFRPIRKGMTLDLRLRGTRIRRRVPLDPRRWAVQVSLPAAGLAPGAYDLAGVVKDAAGKPLAPPAARRVLWRTLSRRPVLAAPEGAKEGDVLRLVRDGRPCVTVVIPDKPDKWTRTAAEWLVRYVKEATGATLPVVAEGRAPAGALVSIGPTEMRKRTGLTLDGVRYDGGRIVVRGNTLFLYGRDDLQFDGQAPKGTCRTVAAFLETCAGVRWYLPGPEGAVVPRLTRLAVPRALDFTCNAAFGYAHGRYPYGVNTPAGLANNFRTAIKVRSYGGHSYYSWVPAKKLFKDHPDYFALIGGKRIAKHNHLCSTNPEVAKLLLAGIRRDFDRGYDWVQLGQEDGYKRCQCPRCEALDSYRGTGTRDTPCERLLLLHKWIADECRKSHPTKTVHLLVYGPTRWPSKKFDKWGDNVVAEICGWDPEIIEAWSGKVRALTGYIYWFDTTVGPAMGIHATPAEVAHKMRFLHASGYIGLYQCIETNWGLQGPSYYAMAKLLADPYLDYREIQREYCLGLFGDKAGPTMNTFFSALYAMPEVHASVWPEATVRRLEALLVKAEGQAASGRPREWVRLTRDHFDFSKNFSRMLAAYRAYKERPNDATWATLKASVSAFEDYRERILNYPDARTKRFFPGYDQFCRFLASKYVGYYQSWKARRAEALRKGVRGTPVGWGIAGGLAKGPLTLDYTKPPPHTVRKK